MQTMSLKGLMELIGHEAIVLDPYYDGGHVLTIYVGHTKAAGPPDPASLWGKTSTVADALAVAHADIAASEGRVRRSFSRSLTQEQFDAAVSFDVNTGAITYATWVKKFNAGDRAGAVAGIMAWKLPASIKERRAKEQKLFDKGVYSNGAKGTLYKTDGKGAIIWSSGKVIDLLPILQPPKPKAPVPAPAAPVKAGAVVPAVQPSKYSARPTGFLQRLTALFRL